MKSYITLMTKDSYLPFTVALWDSWKKVESKYPFVALPKKEIRENKEEKGKGALAKRTKDIMADYDIHVSANNNFKVDSTLGETNNKETLTAKEIKKKIDSFDR